MLAPFGLSGFRRLFAAYSVNTLGDWLGEIALALIVLRTTHSALAVTALFVLGTFVPAAAGPVLVARLGRSGTLTLPLLLGAEGALFALAAAAATTLPLAVLLLIVLVDGAFAVAARGLLKAAAVAETHPAGLLREGNAALVSASAACAAAGPLVAGAIVAATGPVPALALNAVSFLLAAVAVRRLAPPATQRVAGARSTSDRLAGALVHLRAHPVLRRLCVVEGLASVAFATVIPIEIVFITGTLHGDAADAGLVLGAWGLGALGGAGLLRRLQRTPLPALFCAGMAGMAAAYAGMGAAHGVPVAAAFSLAGGIGNGVAPFAFLSAVQERTPAALQAEVNALIEALHTAAPGLGFLLGGLTAWALSPRMTYWAAALAVAALLVIAGRSLVERAPASASAPDAVSPRPAEPALVAGASA
jgi:hypothetical protein